MGTSTGDDVLERFSPATASWFRGSFSAPTPAQVGAWQAISAGEHTLVVAPTGSGKTLAAFLWALDRVGNTPPADPAHRCRVLYISPVKALAVDVERNLRSPLVGIGHTAERLGLPRPQVTVAVRSGDTPPTERRAFARTPTDVLITTPESLFLLLTSAARESLRGIETVIIDEVHAVAGTKRGAHLALSLERLDALLPRPVQRIGLSATVRPVDEVGRWLTGGRVVTVVQPPSTKEWDLQVVVPVADMSDLDAPTGDLTGAAYGAERTASIWPHVEERVVDLIAQHQSTLVFANSRRLAERLTTRLNEIWADRGHEEVLARAHHGSVSKEQRALIEDDLKAGRLPAVVATSSLELGIDMGAVDLVVQVESPPSVASGLQRVGRAGHQVGAVSRGVLFPKYRGDLVQTAVVVERMRSGEIEAFQVPSTPLDVLAQQVVAMCAMDEWTVEEVESLARRTASYASLSRSVLEAVLDMLAGRYPSDGFAALRPRITWDRVTGVLTGRRGAQRLAVTSGGTIPDRGLFGVFLAGAEGPGRRVGELDEEMVYESRVGDVFTLGTSAWRVQEITHDRVLVTPAPGEPGRLPFWKGDQQGRPAELGRALGAFLREVGGLPEAQQRARVRAAGLDDWASDNLLAHLNDQVAAVGRLPHDRGLVLERFRDEIGDWRVVLHSPFGSRVHAPWALCIAARLRARFGVEVQAMHADDGIVLRLPDIDVEDPSRFDAELIDLVLPHADDVADLVTAEVGGSAVFASRFRECAARALLLPRPNPGRRQPLWQQRQRAVQLLEVAQGFPDFPITLEAVRECLQDVFDVPGLVTLMREVESRAVTVTAVETRQPSPFARGLLFGYVAAHLYDGDSPLAERRAAALSLDPELLDQLLGRDAGLSLRDLLDPAQVRRTEDELQHLAAQRAARDAEDILDLLRTLGPLPAEEVAHRCVSPVAGTVEEVLSGLVERRLVIAVPVAGQSQYVVVEDAARVRDALGAALPVGLAQAFLEPVPDPLGDLVARHARTHGPFTAAAVATRYGLGAAVAQGVLRRLVSDGRVTSGELIPLEQGGGREPEYCDVEVLRLLRRRSLAALRAEVEPVTTADYARFLPAWQHVGGELRGSEGALRAVEQLAGAVLPASALETLILPARVRGYTPALLDELTARGDVLWRGHGPLAGDDGWVSLHPADTAHLTLPAPADPAELGPLSQRVLEAVPAEAAVFDRTIIDAVTLSTPSSSAPATEAEVVDALWELVWAGHLTSDTIRPLRALLAGSRTTHRTPPGGPRGARLGRFGRGTLGGPTLAAHRGARTGLGSTAAGRWTRLPDVETDATVRAWAAAEVLLDRYGVLTRGPVVAEEVAGGFAAIHRVLSAAEEAGKVRRGYFVESLGGSQFGSTGAVDRLRASARLPVPQTPRNPWEVAPEPTPAATVLAATDPANPYGAALEWPPSRTVDDEGGTHRPGRKAGAVVALVDGDLVLFLERGGRTALTFTEDRARLGAAATALADLVTQRRLDRLVVERIDGRAVLSTESVLREALSEAGFHLTTRGLRFRT